MLVTWKSVVSVLARGGTWAAAKLGPRRVVISATTLAGMTVEVVVPEAEARTILAALVDIVGQWDDEDARDARMAALAKE